MYLNTRALICLLMAVILVGIKHAQADDKDEARRVVALDKIFSIIPPPGWDSDAQVTSKGTILSRKGGAQDRSSNLVVKLSFLPSGLTLEEHAKKSLDALRKQLTKVVDLEEGTLNIDSRQAYFAFMKANRQNTDIAVGIYLVQGNGSTLYLVTYTMVPTVYERLKEELKRSAGTIKVK